MNIRPSLFILLLMAAPLLAQAPADPAPAPSPEELGFQYHVPADWHVIDAQASLPEVKKSQMAKAKTDDEKREIACVQIPISARHGSPPSFMVAMALPFDCVGQILTEKDLPGFA